ncbi:MAG: phenylalanine--tRNA ligase subunit alpha [Chloroflexota bacterium]
MLEQLEALKTRALRELDGISQIQALEPWRVRYLGKKSELTGILRGLSGLALEARKAVGGRANRVKIELEDSLARKREALEEAQMASPQGGITDISLPGRPLPGGRWHPITQTIREISDIFVSMGFQVVEGPEAEKNYYNFTALNIPDEHPARDTQATFWLDPPETTANPVLLRTHTTSVTARILETRRPPIRVIEPGKVYRYEAIDTSHLPMFHQIDGVAVDRGITMADLKGTLYEFARRFFGEGVRVRFRCDYFPFVEPGVEMAIGCSVCAGKGCRVCGNTGWIEILGAGMLHPQVLRYAGIDPEVYSGLAWGMGVERLPMLRYGIDDIRLFYSNDLRFLRQF